MTKDNIKIYKSSVISTGSDNGGRMGGAAAESISGAVGDVLPNVPKAERLAGSNRYFKIFVKAADDNDGTFLDAKIWLHRPTAGEDWVTIFAGTADDTQGDITGTERHYGSAWLTTTAGASTQTLIVQVEDASLATGAKAIFQVGDEVVVSTKTDPEAVSGMEEWHEIASVAVDGTTVTLGLVGTLAAEYTVAATARVSSVLALGDIVASVGAVTATTAGDGDYDDSTYPPIPDNIGTVDDILRLSFTDANAFTGTLVARAITVGSGGNRSADFAPLNTDFAKPYATVEAGGWTGTWANGDTLDVPLYAAAAGVWINRVVPVGCSSLSDNKVHFGIDGESA